MGYFNTGLPCEHALLVAICYKEKILVSPRWLKKGENLLMEMEDTCRNERIIKMLEQHTIDQKLVYENFSKQI